MTQFTEAYDFHGRTLVDRDGEKIGTVDEVYSSQEGGPPEWALVHTGRFGTRKNFVPLRGASPGGGEVHVAVDTQAVKDSPSVEADDRALRGRGAPAVRPLRNSLHGRRFDDRPGRARAEHPS